MNKKLNLVQTLLLMAVNTLIYMGISFLEWKSNFHPFLALFLFLCLSFLLTGFIIFFFNHKVERMIEEIRRTLIQLNEGNFTTRIKLHTKRRDLNDVIEQVENLKNMLNIWIYQLLHSSVSIKSSADKINSASERTREGMGDLNRSLSDIRYFFEETTEMLSDMAAATTQLALSGNNIAGSSTSAVDSVQQANEAAVNGRDAVSKVTSSMHQIKNDVGMTSGIIASLEQATKQIDTITGTITAISSQTNMLALNAAIEAARAGEHGKGFAVVSEEVRKLSDETGEAAEQINTLIHSIQLEVANAVNSMGQVSEEVDKGVAVADNAKENLHNILSTIEHTVHLIEGISGDVNQQSQGTDLISKNTTAVAEKGHTGTASAQEIACVVETQMQDILQNNTCAKELLHISNDLEGIMERFDRIIGEQMLEACTYIAGLHAKRELSYEDLIELCKETGLTEIHLINEGGFVTHSSNKDILGFRFSQEEGTQTSEFLRILKDSKIKINQKSAFREVDGKLYKYTGVAMIEKNGIVQAGLDASKMSDFNGIIR